MAFASGRDAHGIDSDGVRASAKNGGAVATPDRSIGPNGYLMSGLGTSRTLRHSAFLAPNDRGGGTALLERPRQKAVKKPDLSPSVARARNDGASLQLLAHEVVFLRQQLQDLTDRERDVAFAVCSGGSNERMAERLCIALPTLRTHLMRLNQKLGTARKGDIVRMLASRLLDAYRNGALMTPASSAESVRPAR